MRILANLALVAVSIALGVVVAYRLSTESMAVVVGLICGLSALIPVVLVVLVLLRRPAAAPPPGGPQPPVIIIQPGATQPNPWTPGAYPPPSPKVSEPPDFRIIGDE